MILERRGNLILSFCFNFISLEVDMFDIDNLWSVASWILVTWCDKRSVIGVFGRYEDRKRTSYAVVYLDWPLIKLRGLK